MGISDFISYMHFRNQDKFKGRTMVLAVSCRLRTAVARVQIQGDIYDVCSERFGGET